MSVAKVEGKMKVVTYLSLGPLAFALTACGPQSASDTAATAREPTTAVSAATEPEVSTTLDENVASPVPLPIGYYAVNESCDVAMGDGASGVVVTGSHLEDLDADYPLLPVADLGDGKFKVGEAFDVLRQTGPMTFVADEGQQYERRLTWCAAARPQ